MADDQPSPDAGDEPADTAPGRPAQVPSVALAELIGCLESDPEGGLDSSMVHEVFARGMVEKRNKGHL